MRTIETSLIAAPGYPGACIFQSLPGSLQKNTKWMETVITEYLNVMAPDELIVYTSDKMDTPYSVLERLATARGILITRLIKSPTGFIKAGTDENKTVPKKYELPKTGSERQTEYMARMKENDPERYKAIKAKNNAAYRKKHGSAPKMDKEKRRLYQAAYRARKKQEALDKENNK